jgi:hypothetical protein
MHCTCRPWDQLPELVVDLIAQHLGSPPRFRLISKHLCCQHDSTVKVLKLRYAANS